MLIGKDKMHAENLMRAMTKDGHVWPGLDTDEVMALGEALSWIARFTKEGATIPDSHEPPYKVIEEKIVLKTKEGKKDAKDNTSRTKVSSGSKSRARSRKKSKRAS